MKPTKKIDLQANTSFHLTKLQSYPPQSCIALVVFVINNFQNFFLAQYLYLYLYIYCLHFLIIFAFVFVTCSWQKSSALLLAGQAELLSLHCVQDSHLSVPHTTTNTINSIHQSATKYKIQSNTKYKM